MGRGQRRGLCGQGTEKGAVWAGTEKGAVWAGTEEGCIAVLVQFVITVACIAVCALIHISYSATVNV